MAYGFHQDAKRELEDAVAYYDNISRELGNAFLEEVERSIASKSCQTHGSSFQKIPGDAG